MKCLTTEEFIQKAQKIHGNKYDYSKVNYKNIMSKIIIICPKHSEFLQTPNNHISNANKNGCPICVYENKRLTTKNFIQKAKEIHGNKYDYSKVNYVNNRTKVIIICHKHGEFLQTPNCHLQKHGCLICSGKQKSNTKRFIERAKQIHGNKYYYTKVNYINDETKVIIVCPKHGEFLQQPNSHIFSKQGCPKCKTSKGELLIEKILNNLNIKYKKEKTFNNLKNPLTDGKLRYDFYLPNENMLIEFHGEQHYKNIPKWRHQSTLEDQQYRDNLKQQYAINNGYKFLVIKYNDNIEETLKQNFITSI